MLIDLDFKLHNRADAATKLIENFPQEIVDNRDSWIICALSLNSVPLANIVAKRFDIKYNILLNEALYAQNNNECEISVVDENREIFIHDELVKSFGISKEYIYDKMYKKYEEEILRKRDMYRDGIDFSFPKDKAVLFVDDSCETTLRLAVALKSAQNAKVKNVAYMCAVVPKETKMILEKNIDNVLYLHAPYEYVNNQHYYLEKLKMLKDDEVLETLKNSENYVINSVSNKGENI